MTLTDLVDGRHLGPDVIARMQTAFANDPHGFVIIDDFLHRDLADGLLASFDGDAAFDEYHALKQAGDGPGREEHAVSASTFAQAAPSRRLARELLMTGSPATDDHSRGWQAHLRLMRMLASRSFQAYLTAVTGITPLSDVTYLCRTMRHGDLCAAHSDAGPGRALGMLLYIGHAWRPEFGGRFQQLADGTVDRSIDPLNNRVILHRPDPAHIHQVEPIADGAGAWRRHSYSIWFGGPVG